MSKIEEIKARWAAVTKAPWSVWARTDREPSGHIALIDKTFVVGSGPLAAVQSDTQAIAAAPEDVRWLVERVERLEARLAVAEPAADALGPLLDLLENAPELGEVIDEDEIGAQLGIELIPGHKDEFWAGCSAANAWTDFKKAQDPQEEARHE